MSALSNLQKVVLTKMGFTDYEVNAFDNAKTPDGKQYQYIPFYGHAWQQMIKDRRRFIKDLTAKGWTKAQIDREINSRYDRKNSNRTPWDLIRAESPTSRQRKVSDFALSRQMKAQRKVKGMMNAINNKAIADAKYRKFTNQPTHLPKPSF